MIYRSYRCARIRILCYPRANAIIAKWKRNNPQIVKRSSKGPADSCIFWQWCGGLREALAIIKIVIQTLRPQMNMVGHSCSSMHKSLWFWFTNRECRWIQRIRCADWIKYDESWFNNNLDKNKAWFDMKTNTFNSILCGVVLNGWKLKEPTPVAPPDDLEQIAVSIISQVDQPPVERTPSPSQSSS